MLHGNLNHSKYNLRMSFQNLLGLCLFFAAGILFKKYIFFNIFRSF
jgi:hypothetical protein